MWRVLTMYCLTGWKLIHRHFNRRRFIRKTAIIKQPAFVTKDMLKKHFPLCKKWDSFFCIFLLMYDFVECIIYTCIPPGICNKMPLSIRFNIKVIRNYHIIKKEITISGRATFSYSAVQPPFDINLLSWTFRLYY